MKATRTFPVTAATLAAQNYPSGVLASAALPESLPRRVKFATSRRLGSLLLAAFARGSATADTAPGVLIRTMVGEVLALIQQSASNDNDSALRRRAARKLLPRFDFGQMARLAAGRMWFKGGRTQRQALETGFRELLISTYAASICSAADGNLALEVKPVRHSAANDVTVETLIKSAHAPAIAVDYSMENQGKGWRVYEILVNGVSLTDRFREAFIEKHARSGIEGIIKILRAKHRHLFLSHDVQARGAA